MLTNSIYYFFYDVNNHLNLICLKIDKMDFKKYKLMCKQMVKVASRFQNYYIKKHLIFIIEYLCHHHLKKKNADFLMALAKRSNDVTYILLMLLQFG
jgi:hypothetical protein